MNSMKPNGEIVVTVTSEGEVTVEAKGVVGGGCKALTKAIEESLGTTTSDKLTADFHKLPTMSNTQVKKAGF